MSTWSNLEGFGLDLEFLSIIMIGDGDQLGEEQLGKRLVGLELDRITLFLDVHHVVINLSESFP